jgi:hypothetical protein
VRREWRRREENRGKRGGNGEERGMGKRGEWGEEKGGAY